MYRPKKKKEKKPHKITQLGKGVSAVCGCGELQKMCKCSANMKGSSVASGTKRTKGRGERTCKENTEVLIEYHKQKYV